MQMVALSPKLNPGSGTGKLLFRFLLLAKHDSPALTLMVVPDYRVSFCLFANQEGLTHYVSAPLVN